MIEINNISKVFKANAGNFNINIKVEDGEVYGIVGPNGSGKTTLIRQILGFTKSDQGEVLIDKISSWKNREDIMKFTGYVAGEVVLFNDLKGIDYLKIVASMKENVEWDFVEKLITHFDLDVNTKIKKMSKGMKQKVAIIAATMNKPKFLVLDEPTSGLDPVMQNQFNNLIEKLKKEEKTTIIICSHIFEEVVNLSNKVGFLKSGVLVEEYKVESKDITTLNEKFKKIFEVRSEL